MNEKPWHRHVDQMTLEAMTEGAQERFFTFHDWYGELSRWLVSIGEERMGVGATSHRLETWLWTIGANAMFEQAPGAVRARLEKMPEFPCEWPAVGGLSEIREHLDCLESQEPMSIGDEMVGDLVGDLLRQARKLKKLADTFEKEAENKREMAEDF